MLAGYIYITFQPVSSLSLFLAKLVEAQTLIAPAFSHRQRLDHNERLDELPYGGQTRQRHNS